MALIFKADPYSQELRRNDSLYDALLSYCFKYHTRTEAKEDRIPPVCCALGLSLEDSGKDQRMHELHVRHSDVMK